MPAYLDRLVRTTHEALREASPDSSVHYLGIRGVSKAEIDKFEIGYAGPSFFIEDVTDPEFIPWATAYLRHSLVFPIFSITGEVIGIQVRCLTPQEGQRQYKQFYSAHRDLHPYMFGLKPALKAIYYSQVVCIVEGVFDCIAMSRYTPNVVAVMTSGVPVSCRRFFNRFTKRVVAVLDMDEAGREGMERLSRSSNSVIVTSYSGGKDPDELWRNGKTRELERLASLTNILPPIIPGV